MADYYPLIARAVAGLERNTGDARRSLYERARTALVAQLRSVTPALNESDVTRERLALEESIRKVEAEAARQVRSEPVRPDSKPRMQVRAPEMPRWEDPPPAAIEPQEELPLPPRRSAPPGPPPVPPRPDVSPRQASAAAAALRQASAPPSGMFGDTRYVDPVFDQPTADGPSTAPPPASGGPAPSARHPLRGRPLGERKSLLDSGLKDFRNVVSESDELGEASERSARTVRENYAGGPASQLRPQDFDPAVQDRPEDAEADAAPHDEPPRMLEPAFSVDDMRPARARTHAQPVEADDSQEEHVPARSYRDLIKIALTILILAGIGSVSAWQLPNMMAFYRYLRTPGPQEAATAAAPANRPKIVDRIEPGGASSQPQQNAAISPNAPLGAAVAQKVVLYEEDPDDPQGKRFVGSAIWRIETISPGPGQAPELAIRADVEIPERRLAMTWSLRRNNDPSLPASHTVEITFKLPSDFTSGGISNVPGILMKAAEQTRGVPLAGLAVKVTNGFFLIGLSAVDSDRERNVQLLKERAWFDIPVVYNNNRRAILALEKGTPGERVFADAFKAWRQ